MNKWTDGLKVQNKVPFFTGIKAKHECKQTSFPTTGEKVHCTRANMANTQPCTEDDMPRDSAWNRKTHSVTMVTGADITSVKACPVGFGFGSY